MTNEEIKAVWPGWEIVRLIGRGSYGAVYEIEQDILGETEKAALKVITIPQSSSDIDALYSEGYSDESITETFRQYLKSIVSEYTLMRKMNGTANVVNCDEVRFVEHSDGMGWDVYIKMELLTPLVKVLGSGVSEAQTVRIGADLCRALALCKKHNIIHRDVKPANIFLSDNGDYKLGDFGIAKTIEKTSGGTRIGTYEYMAPEVYNEQPYGSTADIYSLGMVLYWLLNERRTPFLAPPPALPTADEKEQARRRRMQGEPIPAPAHGSDALKRIVLKACAFDPKDRWQSAEEMLQALLELETPAAPAVTPAAPAPDRSAYDEATEGLFMGAQAARPPAAPPVTGALPDELTLGSDATSTGTEAAGWRFGGNPALQDAPTLAQPRPAPQPPPGGPAAAPAYPPYVVQKQPKKRFWLWGGIAAAAVLCAVICLIVFLPKRGTDRPSGQTAATAAPDVTPLPPPTAVPEQARPAPTSDVRLGVILLYDENTPECAGVIRAAEEACEATGALLTLRTNVSASILCYDVIDELIDGGCNVILTADQSYESYTVQSAKKYADVQFCCMGGVAAYDLYMNESLSNYHTVYAAIHEGRYLTGVAAGLKLNQMIERGTISADQAKLGFVAPFPYTEVKSAYSAFFLGARSVCPSAVMEVQFINSWHDAALERSAAQSLIRSGCVLIGQYAASGEIPQVCAAAGVPCVAYGSGWPAGTDGPIVSCDIDWDPYLEDLIRCKGKASLDWICTLYEGAVLLGDINEAVAAPGTAETLERVKASLISGSTRVFDTSTFTVNGKTVTSYETLVGTGVLVETVKDGEVQECAFQSFPIFGLDIDGITLRS